MQNWRTKILAVALIVAATAPASAQQGLRGSGGFIGGFNLVGMPAIQDELKMDEAQRVAGKKVAERMKARYTQDMGKLRGLNADEQAKRRVTLADAHYQEGMQQVGGFLKPDQVERLDQILIQQRGPTAMLEPKIAEVLQLRNEQAQKVAAIMAEELNQERELFRDAGSKPTPEVGVKVEELRNAARARTIDVLSPEQRRTWARVLGEPFRPASGGESGGQAEAGPAPK